VFGGFSVIRREGAMKGVHPSQPIRYNEREERRRKKSRNSGKCGGLEEEQA